MRSVPEWIGKHDDEKIPQRVSDRVLDRYGGRCYLSGIEIRAGDLWDLDHIKALSLGGEHRESNLAPVLRDKHKEKTKDDRRLKAKTDRMRKKHLGIWKGSGRKIKSRGFKTAISGN